MGGRLLVLTLVLFFLVSLGHVLVEACLDPSDRYSVEVVLSKPGIVFNASVFDGLRGVVRILGGKGDQEVFVYRSHVDPEDLVVVLSFQLLSLREDGERYLTVRVEGKTVVVEETTRTYRIVAKDINRTIGIKEFEDAIRDYDWVIKGISTCPCGSSAGILLSKDYEEFMVEAVATLSNTSRSASILLTTRLKGKVNDTLVLSELESIIRKVMGDEAVINVSKTISVEGLVEPAPGINEELLKKALRIELEWLSSIGAVKGLSIDDLDEIMKSIREGMAGWNERLVYYNGSWKPYSELVKNIPGAMLVKSGYGCSWSYPLELLPDTPPQLNNNQTLTPSTTMANTSTIGEETSILPLPGTTSTAGNEETHSPAIRVDKSLYLTPGLILLALIAGIAGFVYLGYRKKR